MNVPPPRPSAMAYTRTNGCGAFNANNAVMSGMQKRSTTVVRSPPTPVTTAARNMLRGATVPAFFVSSARCPGASNPVRTLDVNRNESIQFHPAGAPVPLYVVSNASLPERRPYVLLAPIGSQMMQRKKSRVIKPAAMRKMTPCRRDGRYVTAVASTRKPSEAAQTSVRHFILPDVMPPGKSTLNTLQRERTQTTIPSHKSATNDTQAAATHHATTNLPHHVHHAQQQRAKNRPCSRCRPVVEAATDWKRRTYFRKDCGGDADTDNVDDEGCPHCQGPSSEEAEVEKYPEKCFRLRAGDARCKAINGSK